VTLGGCIEQIGRIFKISDIEQLSRIGMELIKKVKEDYGGKEYPKQGWLILDSEETPLLANGDVLLEINLNPPPYRSKRIKQLEERIRMGHRFSSEEESRRESYTQKVIRLEKERSLKSHESIREF
jgi:hypothetical protein